MSWKLKEKNRHLLADETGAVIKDPGGKTSVALIYPNTYHVGMSNLAVHSLYKLLNDHPGIVCERAFLPEGKDIGEHRRTETSVLTIESQRPISEFDVIAFTVSFENDFLNIIPILELSKINHRLAERTEDDPLVIAGGVAVTLNPLSIAQIMDGCVVGEFEAFSEELIAALTSGELPKLQQKRYLQDLDQYPTQTVIWTPHTEFGSMHLIEVMRGCPRNCAFCATPGLYSPPRMHSYETVMKMIDEGSKHRQKFGLIGAEIASHPDFKKIAESILDRGYIFSLSSIRVDRINSDVAQLLKRSGTRSISLGIEAASDELRASIGKKFTNDRCMVSIATLAHEGITNLRLYFMIGLPGEKDSDIDSIHDFTAMTLETLRKHAPKEKRTSSVELTVTPFVPKPLSEFSDKEFIGIKRINEIQKRLKQLMGSRKDIKLSFDSAQQAAVEAYLAKAGPEAIEFLEEAHRKSPRAAIKSIGF